MHLSLISRIIETVWIESVLLQSVGTWTQVTSGKHSLASEGESEFKWSKIELAARCTNEMIYLYDECSSMILTLISRVRSLKPHSSVWKKKKEDRSLSERSMSVCCCSCFSCSQYSRSFSKSFHETGRRRRKWNEEIERSHAETLRKNEEVS